MFEDPEMMRSAVVAAGILLQLVGLVVVIYQLTRLNASIRVTAQSALYTQSADIRTLLVEHPHLRPYFFDGKELADGDPERNRVRTIAEMILNYLEHLIIQDKTLRKQDHLAWKEFVARTLAGSPVMRETIEERKAFYSGDLVRVYEDCRG